MLPRTKPSTNLILPSSPRHRTTAAVDATTIMEIIAMMNVGFTREFVALTGVAGAVVVVAPLMARSSDHRLRLDRTSGRIARVDPRPGARGSSVEAQRTTVETQGTIPGGKSETLHCASEARGEVGEGRYFLG